MTKCLLKIIKLSALGMQISLKNVVSNYGAFFHCLLLESNQQHAHLFCLLIRLVTISMFIWALLYTSTITLRLGNKNTNCELGIKN